MNERAQKKFMAYVRLQINLPPPPIQASALLAGPRFTPSELTYFMNDPLSKPATETCKFA